MPAGFLSSLLNKLLAQIKVKERVMFLSLSVRNLYFTTLVALPQHSQMTSRIGLSAPVIYFCSFSVRAMQALLVLQLHCCTFGVAKKLQVSACRCCPLQIEKRVKFCVWHVKDKTNKLCYHLRPVICAGSQQFDQREVHLVKILPKEMRERKHINEEASPQFYVIYKFSNSVP